MRRLPLTAWLRPAIALFTLTGILALSACGGGGGSVQTPPEVPASPSAITVFPPSQTIYPGSSATLTISGGTPPYRVFSSNTAILPVAENVNNNQVLLFANAVSTSTSVTITIQDSGGQTGTSTVIVAPAILFPSGLTISASDTSCGTASLCTGGTGTVRVQATGVGGSVLAGRQIRFQVVYGAFGILSQNPATPLVQTLTVTTDAAGVATVGIQALVDVETQPAQIQATDLTSGQNLVGNFTIVRNQNGANFLTVVPATATLLGPDTATCSSGVPVDYRIFGGAPPYRVTASFPTSVTIVNPIVQVSGGYFEVITNGSCVDPVVFSIVDSLGKQTTATLSNKFGTTPVPVSPTPVVTPDLIIVPNEIYAGAPQSCAGKTFPVAISGGTPPYNISQVVPAQGTRAVYSSPLSSPGTVTFYNLDIPSTATVTSGVYRFTVTDATGKAGQITVNCLRDP